MAYNKLRGRIVEKYGSIVDFASAWGKSRETATKKLSGKIDFNQTDIKEISTVLDIPKKEIVTYFFSE